MRTEYREVEPRRGGGRRPKQETAGTRLQGFTLAEVMVSVFILMAAVLSGTFLFASLARSTSFTAGVAQATELAQDKLEELLEQPYGHMGEGSDVADDFRRSWSFSNETDFVAIRVTVDWDVLEGNTRAVSLATIRAH